MKIDPYKVTKYSHYGPNERKVFDRAIKRRIKQEVKKDIKMELRQ